MGDPYPPLPPLVRLHPRAIGAPPAAFPRPSFERSAIETPTIRIEVADSIWEAPLPPRAVRVGSGETCDLRLGCEGVATDHCVFRPLAGGRFVVKDASSGLPTRVNGAEIQQIRLEPGDVVEVGDARIVFAPVSEPLAEAVVAPATTPREGTALPAAATTKPASVRATRVPQKGGHRLAGPLLGLGAAAALAIGLAILVRSTTSGSEEAGAQNRLERALDLYRDRDYEAAREALTALAQDPTARTEIHRVERYLRQTNEAINAAQSDLDRYWGQRLDFSLASVATAREVFRQKHGESMATRFDEMVERIREDQTTWTEEQVQRAGERVAALLESEEFAAARTAWQALRARRYAGVDLKEAVDTGLREVEHHADGAAARLLASAEEIDVEHGPERALQRVKAKLRCYEGTRAYGRVLEAVEALEARVRTALAAAGPTYPPTSATEPTPGTPTTATPDDTAKRAVEAVLAQVAEAASKWHFADAVVLLDGALDDAGDEGVRGHEDLRTRLEARREDLDLAREGLDALAGDISAHPERYRRIEMGPGFFVAFVRASCETVTGAIPGGTTEYRWAALPPTRVAYVIRRMKAEGRAALGLAALLREAEAEEDVDGLLVAAGEGGVESTVLFPLIARWRGETLPVSGYVCHEGRYVTPEERERLEFLARITHAAKRVRQRDARVWKEAAEELLALGPEARATLLQALHSRRGDVLDELAGLRAFSSSRTKSKLFSELEKRRRHALALIQDAVAWPYPNPSGRNTDEVVARVDAVREVWERPFDVIVAWSDEARSKLGLVSEVDEYLVRADPSFQPSFDDLRERVRRAVDMPTYTPNSAAKSLRQYYLKVLAFNEKLPTTATLEEKECVLAVNEYRMMMGRQALKINERLVRAARGHSHHMRENNYFAHNVPSGNGATDENRTPGNRARTQGYGGGVGENIARGTWTGRDAFSAWFRSSGHHRNMINAHWTEMGAGRSGGSWWTQLFGGASGRKLSLPDALPAPAPFFAPEPEDERGRPAQPGRPEFPDEPPVVPPDWPDEPEEPDEPAEDEEAPG